MTTAAQHAAATTTTGRTRGTATRLAMLGLAATLWACGGDDQPAATGGGAKPGPTSSGATPGAAPAPDTAPAPQDPSTINADGAGISGKVTFAGTPPAAAPVDMASDPYCVGAHEAGFARSPVVVGAGGGLAHVFAAIVGAPDARYDVPDAPVVLDQVGCVYVPQVFGIMAKQPLEILNSDDTLHNIHAVPRDNKEFNVGMPNKGMKVTKEFKKAEDAILIKCDVHPWMATYGFSMSHPFFAASAADGTLTIPTVGLPDGDYQVKLWHRELGTAQAKVTVKDGAGSFAHAFGG